MRTTLDIADDVLAAAKERARHEGKTAGEVISALARQALTQASSPAGVAEQPATYGFAPFGPRGGIVTNQLINALRDDDAH